MTYTKHGHHIPESAFGKQPYNVAPCGGPHQCEQCCEETKAHHITIERFIMSYTSHGYLIPGTQPSDPEPFKGRCFGPNKCVICMKDVKNWNDSQKALNSIDMVQNLSVDFQHQAMQMVRNYIINNYEGGEKLNFDTYVVWFSKTLQNWKAIVCTTMSDGHMYEVTHNGDKNETYLDDYVKVDNVVIPD